MARKEEYIFGLDVGSSKTCALICRQGAESSLAVAGWGVAESRRWRRGNIANLDAAVASIREAVDTAESTAGFAVDSAYVGIAGTHIRGVNAQGGVSLGQQAREVTAEDVQNVVERAQSVSLPRIRRSFTSSLRSIWSMRGTASVIRSGCRRGASR